MALIIGAPGLGKSRLLAELLDARRKADTVRVLNVRCRPAGEEGSNTPLRQLIEADVPEAAPYAVRSRLIELLGSAQGANAAAAILHSTGLEPSPELLAINRYEQRSTIAEAWRRYLAVVLDGLRPPAA